MIFKSTFKMEANRDSGQFLSLEPFLGFFLRHLDPHSSLPSKMRPADLREVLEGGLSVLPSLGMPCLTRFVLKLYG